MVFFCRALVMSYSTSSIRALHAEPDRGQPVRKWVVVSGRHRGPLQSVPGHQQPRRLLNRVDPVLAHSKITLGDSRALHSLWCPLSVFCSSEPRTGACLTRSLCGCVRPQHPLCSAAPNPVLLPHTSPCFTEIGGGPQEPTLHQPCACFSLLNPSPLVPKPKGLILTDEKQSHSVPLHQLETDRTSPLP